MNLNSIQIRESPEGIGARTELVCLLFKNGTSKKPRSSRPSSEAHFCLEEWGEAQKGNAAHSRRCQARGSALPDSFWAGRSWQHWAVWSHPAQDWCPGKHRDVPSARMCPRDTLQLSYHSSYSCVYCHRAGGCLCLDLVISLLSA